MGFAWLLVKLNYIQVIQQCLHRILKEASWIAAHVHMMEYYGGAACILVSDNLKTGIISNRKHEDPIANKVCQELADHYGMALMRVLGSSETA